MFRDNLSQTNDIYIGVGKNIFMESGSPLVFFIASKYIYIYCMCVCMYVHSQA